MIPYGKVATYGQIAMILGLPNCARQVGRALRNAPDDMSVPCHRVVNSSGRTAPGWPEQIDLLKSEGILFKENGCVDIKNFIWRWIGLDESRIRTVKKDTFTVVGKRGSGKSNEGGSWIPPLWEQANGHFNEIASLVKYKKDGKPYVWGAMSDINLRFERWEEVGSYLAGCEMAENVQAPEGWTVWNVPANIYAVVDCSGLDYGEVLTYMNDVYIPLNGYRQAGAVHEFYPEPGNGGKLELYFPIKLADKKD